MNSNNDLKSGQKKLSVQMFILIAVIILVAAGGIVAMKFSTGNEAGNGLKSSQMSIKLLKDISLVQTNLYKIQVMVASNQDKKEIEKFSEQQAALLNDDIASVKKLLDSDISVEQKKYFQGILGNLSEYQKAAVRFMKLAPVGTGAAYLSAASEKMEAVNGLLMELSALENKTDKPASGSSGLMFYAVLAALAVLFVCSVFLIPAFVKSMINRHVVEPIEEATDVVKDFCIGNYNRQLAGDSADAIGELVQALSILRTRLGASTAAQTVAKAAPQEAVPAARDAGKHKAGDSSKTLSGLIKKTPEHDNLVLSSKKAIDRLQDI